MFSQQYLLGLSSSGMLRPIDWSTVIAISKRSSAFIFRVIFRNEFLRTLALQYWVTVKKAPCFSKMSRNIYQSQRRNVSENLKPNEHKLSCINWIHAVNRHEGLV